MRVYLAGPMRGCENFNRAAFAHWAQVLRAKGHEVFSPSENSVRLFGGRALAEAIGRRGAKGPLGASAKGDLRHSLRQRFRI
jgi:hypothetical protein